MDGKAILEQLNRADMVLVGLGEVFDGTGCLKQSERYVHGCKLLKETGLDWLLPGWKEYCLEQLGDSSIDKALGKLQTVLAEKNHFIVSVSTHSKIGEGRRVVMPCGSAGRKQCSEDCEKMLSEVTDTDQESLWRGFSELWEGRRPKEEPWLGVCGNCGAVYTFNTIYSDHYNEKGYSDQWKLYTKWLQGTLHHSLVILELGVGMSFPSVIRWPFEKTAFLNQKAYLYRVNENLYQLAEELAGKGQGISEDAVDWIAGL